MIDLRGCDRGADAAWAGFGMCRWLADPPAPARDPSVPGARARAQAVRRTTLPGSADRKALSSIRIAEAIDERKDLRRYAPRVRTDDALRAMPAFDLESE